MKTMKSISTFATLILAAVTLSSCEADGDTTKPEITLTSPAEGATLAADGDGIHFDMELSDDVALGSYKVEIHSNFDGHEHASVTVMRSEETVDFSYNNTWYDIAGQRNATIHHHEIIIPTDATHGDYHFMVYCVDAAGNESYVVRNIVISDEGDDEDHDHDAE